jgi:hypothetical protein
VPRFALGTNLTSFTSIVHAQTSKHKRRFTYILATAFIGQYPPHKVNIRHICTDKQLEETTQILAKQLLCASMYKLQTLL